MTYPRTDRFTTTVLKNWLEPQILSAAKVFVGREPDVGRAIVITSNSGAGLQMEGLFDTPSFNIRCLGAESNYADAENIAIDVDTIFMHAPTSFDIGDVRVDYIGRVGGAPQSLPYQDTSNRYVFTCNYYAVVSTGL